MFQVPIGRFILYTDPKLRTAVMIGRIFSRIALPLDRVDVWSNPHYVSVRQTGWPLWLEELSLRTRRRSWLPIRKTLIANLLIERQLRGPTTARNSYVNGSDWVISEVGTPLAGGCPHQRGLQAIPCGGWRQDQS
jgi:hypothetical protein